MPPPQQNPMLQLCHLSGLQTNTNTNVCLPMQSAGWGHTKPVELTAQQESEWHRATIAPLPRPTELSCVWHADHHCLPATISKVKQHKSCRAHCTNPCTHHCTVESWHTCAEYQHDITHNISTQHNLLSTDNSNILHNRTEAPCL